MLFLASPSTVESSSSMLTSTQEKPRDSWALDSMLQSSFFSGISTGSASASPNLFANFPNNKSKTPGKLNDHDLVFTLSGTGIDTGTGTKIRTLGDRQ